MEMSAKQNQDPYPANFDGNPHFVVIDHELETPDGIEGPVSVSVKPDINFDSIQEKEADINNAQSQTLGMYKILS